MTKVILVVALAALVACAQGKAAENGDAKAAPAKDTAAGLKVSADMQKKWGVQVALVSRVAVAARITLPGIVTLDQSRSAEISPLLEGKVVSVRADLGQQVHKGQVLVVVHSPAFAQAQTAFLQARERRELAAKEFERAKELLKQEAIQQKEYQRRQSEYEAATTDYGLQESTMHSLGVDHPHLDVLIQRATSGQADLSDLAVPYLEITSPIDGRVIVRDVILGEPVTAGKVLFLVSDLTTLWAVLDARESDLPSLSPASHVTIRSAVYPDKAFEGRNVRTGDLVDEKLRTIKVRVEVANTGLLLKPNMYVQGVVDTPSPVTREALAVPEDAIQTIGGETTVFVLSAADRFVPCTVALGEKIGANRVITKGLQGTETIAIKGSFNLKSEMMKHTLGGE
jgi:membrane fusion protein, heavy metal efflux system